MPVTGPLLGSKSAEEVQTDVKKLLNLEGFKYDDDVLPAYVRAAVAAVAQHVGPLTRRTVTETVAATTDGRLVLGSWPLLSVTTVTSSDGITLTGATPDLTLGVLAWASGGSRPTPGRTYTVVYDAGYDDVPDDIWVAVVEMVRHLFRSFRAARPGTRDATAPSTSGRPGIPTAVATLLQAHHVPGVA